MKLLRLKIILVIYVGLYAISPQLTNCQKYNDLFSHHEMMHDSFSNRFFLMPNVHKQTIWGIGFEIQCDAIGSANTGLPELKIAVPHDLLPSERDRLSAEMLKGFRYCRLAGGLYWRGLCEEKKYLRPRWPKQLEEVKTMMEKSDVEGLAFEYWSPPPYWKANQSYIGKGKSDSTNTLRCFGPDFKNDSIYKGDTTKFLKDYAKACLTDIKTLEKAGFKISMWGMQNEPWLNEHYYPNCKYFNHHDYVQTYQATASAIRKHNPSILLISDTENGYPSAIAVGMHHPDVAKLVDAYVVHTIGWDSKTIKEIHDSIRTKLPWRPWFQNEYEYLQDGTSPERCLNTVQHIMNSFQLSENPSWFWIHALKPHTNSEASGYSLGFWKSLEDTAEYLHAEGSFMAEELNELQPGHWVFNDFNWNAVGSFIKQMPWDCKALNVIEERYDDDARIFFYQKPDGKRVVVLSNRKGSNFKFNIETQMNASWKGYRYSPYERGANTNGVEQPAKNGSLLTIDVPNLTWEFWVEQ